MDDAAEQPGDTKKPRFDTVWVLVEVQETDHCHVEGDAWSELKKVAVYNTKEAAEDARIALVYDYVRERVEEENYGSDDDDHEHTLDPPAVRQFEQMNRMEVEKNFNRMNQGGTVPIPYRIEIRECEFHY